MAAGRGGAARLLRLLLAQRLHLLDVAVDLLPLVGGDLLFLRQVLVELVDRLLGLAQLLVAAADVAQVNRVQRLRVQLREQSQRVFVAPGGKRFARLHLGRAVGQGLADASSSDRTQHPAPPPARLNRERSSHRRKLYVARGVAESKPSRRSQSSATIVSRFDARMSRWATSTCTCSRKAHMRALTRASARTSRVATRRPPAPASTSRSGRRTPTASTSSATSNGWGTRAAPLAPRGEPASGKGSSPGIGKGARYKYRIVSQRRRLPGRQGRSVRRSAARCRRRPASMVWDLDYSVGRRRVDGSRARTRNAPRRADVDLRGAPRLVDARPRGGATARSATARSRPSSSTHVQSCGFTHVELMPLAEHPFYRVVGLPDDRLLRADVALRHARGLHVVHRLPAPGRASA